MTVLEQHILELCSLALAYADKKDFEHILAQLKAALIEHEAERASQDRTEYAKSYGTTARTVVQYGWPMRHCDKPLLAMLRKRAIWRHTR